MASCLLHLPSTNCQNTHHPPTPVHKHTYLNATAARTRTMHMRAQRPACRSSPPCTRATWTAWRTALPPSGCAPACSGQMSWWQPSRGCSAVRRRGASRWVHAARCVPCVLWTAHLHLPPYSSQHSRPAIIGNQSPNYLQNTACVCHLHMPCVSTWAFRTSP